MESQVHQESCMPKRMISRAAVLGSFLFLTGMTAVAQEPEVPHPQLPEGAGKVDSDAPKSFTKTSSGLQYRILRKGTGAKPKATNKVNVNYHGWLDNGTVFDSS